MKHLTRAQLARSMAVVLTALAGCALTGLTPGGSPAKGVATPIPMVQNCAVVNIGSPSKFACNGKVYTTFELAKIREDAAKKAAAGN